MTGKIVKIFLVEDDLSFGSVLKSYLELNDFTVDWVDDGKYAVEHFRKGSFDICILDVMLPHVDGFTIAGEIRKINTSVPIVFLTAKKLKEDVLKGYGSGGDDYITKPFDPEVLILRINNILKRVYSSSTDEFKISDTILKFNTLELTSGSTTEKLTLKEAQLLKYFIINKNKMLAREDILTEIWGEDDYFLGRSMDVFISRLRKYISEDKNIDIRTVRGTGFILEEINK